LGDVYKSRLLVEAALEGKTDLGVRAYGGFSKKVEKMHLTDPAWAPWKAMVATPELLAARVKDMLEKLELQIWTEMMEGLMASNACSDYLEQSREAVAKFPTDEVFPSEVANAESWLEQRRDILQGQLDEGEITENQMLSTLNNGGVYPTAFPWMEENLVRRDDVLFQPLRKEFSVGSSNCTVSRSTFGHASEEDGTIVEIDVLGVVATEIVESGTTVLLDSTVAGVITSNTRCPTCCGKVLGNFTNLCCSVKYCSAVCSKTASTTFHPALCGKDIAFLFDDAKSAESTTSFSLDSLLLLRVLALSLQENVAQPLQTTILNRLTPTYDMDHLIIFNFHAHIITPIRILQALSVDIFSNPLYDTWVLHTIRCRLQNNKHGQTLDGLYGTAVNPLYSMFNHSCEPNVEWEHVEENSTLRCFSRRDIEQGEELFISYIGYGEMEYSERQGRLAPWLGKECRCTRCVRERSEEE
jgi:hypothetical protein